jgi:hypothetical protein
MATLWKAIYSINAIPIKIPDIFHRNRNENTKDPKIILSKKSKAGGILIPEFKLYYRTIVMKTAWYQKILFCSTHLR